MAPRLGGADELDPLPNQCLAGLIGRMRLAGDDDLYRPLGIGQQAQQTRRIVQQKVRSLVRREAPRETDGQDIRIEHVAHALAVRRWGA
jgi:hypothetical protein